MQFRDRALLDYPVFWWGVCALANLILSWIMPNIRYDSWAFAIFGYCTIIVGFVLIVWSLLSFRRQKTSPMPREKPSSLIDKGLFSYSRNPMYCGMAATLLGQSFVLQTPLAIIGILIFASVMQLRIIPQEERILHKTFGVEAEHYMKATRRWF